MAKNKKRQHRKEGGASLILEGEEFPTALTVELWHRRSKGKRELIGSRRYEMVVETPALAPSDTAALQAEPTAGDDGVAAGTAARPVSAKRPRQPRPKATPPPEV